MASHRTAMRWLLIAMTVLLQVQMPAMARASATELSCHSMAMDERQDERRQPADRAPPPAAHICPGCGIPVQAPLIERRGVLSGARPAAAASAQLVSLIRAPLSPPPRNFRA